MLMLIKQNFSFCASCRLSITFPLDTDLFEGLDYSRLDYDLTDYSLNYLFKSSFYDYFATVLFLISAL